MGDNSEAIIADVTEMNVTSSYKTSNMPWNTTLPVMEPNIHSFYKVSDSLQLKY